MILFLTSVRMYLPSLLLYRLSTMMRLNLNPHWNIRKLFQKDLSLDGRLYSLLLCIYVDRKH